ncbi:hypothetical protein [Microbispora sp. NPDC046933]|uniref:hypothetical protein n=1 Tax=Microbispora sp. NPDC046933 TaxID=3155618 RepID=UPI0033D28B4E
MSEPAIRPNETTVPLMPCVSVEETLANDDLQAFRALKSAVRRRGADASPMERAIALCHLVDLATALGEPTDPWLADLRGLELTADDRQRVESELGHLAGLREWLA